MTSRQAGPSEGHEPEASTGENGGYFASACLLPEHLSLVRGSAITEHVAEQRGYRSVEVKSELRRLGFADFQCRVPALLIPIRGVGGEIVTYQSRPFDPRIVNGKGLKYETPAGSRMCLDVPVHARQWLGDPGVPLFITEGARKADAGVSAGLCAISVLGVWNWRGTNEHGGKAALADWDSIALNGRKVYLVFDSDVMEKPAVHLALGRLKGFLETRDASVSIVYLSAAPGGEKVGLDDFLAAGGTTDDLVSLAANHLRPLPEAKKPPGQYQLIEGVQTLHHKPAGEDGATVPIVLANFTAQIAEEIVEDDGVERRHVFGVRASLRGRTFSFRIPAERFSAMNWVPENLGASAVVSAGFGNRDHLRAAIQICSEGIVQRHLYRHLGWREIGGRHVFLHAGGGICESGAAAGVEVDLESPLDRFHLLLPKDEADLRHAVRECVQLLTSGLARDATVFPLFSTPWCAVLGDSDFSLHLVGETGTCKTELAALVQRHFGGSMDATHLPGSWSSTANANEELAFLAKDVVSVIDDFVPKGSSHDVQRAHAAADRVFRGQANRSGRARSQADGSRRPVRPPRGLVLSTGEEIPAGHSAQARMHILTVDKDEVDLAVLTARQRMGDRYCVAMAGFVRWIASRRERVRAAMAEAVERDRHALIDGLPHKRTATMGAKLLFGLRTFLEFAFESGAVGADEHELLLERGRGAILASLGRQADHLREADPARAFLKLLSAALQSGEAHLQDAKDGGVPQAGDEIAMLVGWHPSNSPNELEARGTSVGFVDEAGEQVYLIPEAATKAAWRMAQGDPAVSIVSKGALSKALQARGLLLSVDGDGERRTKTVRLAGQPRGVYHLALSCLCPESANNANNGNNPAPEAQEGGLFPSDVPVEPPGTGTDYGNRSASSAPGSGPFPDVPDVSAPPTGGGDCSGRVRWEG